MCISINKHTAIPIYIVSGNSEITQWFTQHLENLGATSIQSTTFFHLPLMRRTNQASVYLLDVTTDSAIDATHKVESLFEYWRTGALIVVGAGQQGCLIANWIRMGVVDYLDWKPGSAELLRSYEIANRLASTIGSLRYEHTVLAERRRSITEGEEQVLEMVMQGVPNKAIAARLSVSQRTVEARRQKIYQKMGATKLADLIRAIDRLERLGAELTCANPAERLASLSTMHSLLNCPVPPAISPY